MPAASQNSRSAGSKRLWALDWLNFWMADVQTGVGPFVAAALTSRGWNPSQVGTFLTLGGITGLCLQTPAGAAVDHTRRKRTLVLAGVAGTVAASLLLAYGKSFRALLGAQLLLGGIGPLIAVAITAITLGLVGRASFDKQIGRNQSFNAAGNVFSALVMGWMGWRFGMRSIFLAVPFLAIPTLLALAAIPAGRIDHSQARGAASADGKQVSRIAVLTRDRGLLMFAIAGFLFHLANAAMLPQLGELLAHGKPRDAAPFMSAAVSVTQLVITLTAAIIGNISAKRGPRTLLIAGFGVLPIRAVLYTLTTAVPLLIAIQVLDGIANAIFGVASAVLIAERTRGSGRFNLAMAGFATVTGIGAALSTVLAGFVTQRFSFRISFLVLGGIAALALLCLLTLVPAAASKEASEQVKTTNERNDPRPSSGLALPEANDLTPAKENLS